MQVHIGQGLDLSRNPGLPPEALTRREVSGTVEWMKRPETASHSRRGVRGRDKHSLVLVLARPIAFAITLL